MASHVFVYPDNINTIHKCNNNCYFKSSYGHIIAKGNIIEGIEAKE